jgi:diaminopropionate ammonia-lyase
VPIGVGSLAQAAVLHYRRPGLYRAPALMSAEPVTAACGLRSLAAGQMTTVPTSVTIMAGLNCGALSEAAWPFLQRGLDAAVAVTDQQDALAADDLARLGVPAGPCGAATLAGARVALTGDGSQSRRARLGLTETSVIVLVCTEGSAANPVRRD